VERAFGDNGWKSNKKHLQIKGHRHFVKASLVFSDQRFIVYWICDVDIRNRLKQIAPKC